MVQKKERKKESYFFIFILLNMIIIISLYEKHLVDSPLTEKVKEFSKIATTVHCVWAIQKKKKKNPLISSDGLKKKSDKHATCGVLHTLYTWFRDFTLVKKMRWRKSFALSTVLRWGVIGNPLRGARKTIGLLVSWTSILEALKTIRYCATIR